tara:strand:- start:469 stop:795 length:327 start_codon:yes stop_codon:yes gene_type:complete
MRTVVNVEHAAQRYSKRGIKSSFQLLNREVIGIVGGLISGLVYSVSEGVFSVEPLNRIVSSISSVSEFLEIRAKLAVELSTHFSGPFGKGGGIFSFKLAEFRIYVNVI